MWITVYLEQILFKRLLFQGCQVYIRRPKWEDNIFFDCYGGDMGWLGGGEHAEKGREIFFKICRIVVGRPLNFILEKKYNNKDKY